MSRSKKAKKEEWEEFIKRLHNVKEELDMLIDFASRNNMLTKPMLSKLKTINKKSGYFESDLYLYLTRSSYSRISDEDDYCEKEIKEIFDPIYPTWY